MARYAKWIVSGLLLAASSSATTGCVQADAGAGETSLKDSSTQRVLGNQFRCGFYYYKASSSTLYAGVTLEEIEADINRMADLGFNYVYVKVDLIDGITSYPRLERILEVSKRRKMAVRIHWSGNASLSQALAGRHTDQWKTGWNAQRLTDNVMPYFEKYQSDPQVIDFVIQEEPDPEALEPLREYYHLILQQKPDLPLMLLYNKLEVAVADRDNSYPKAIGHDNYPFKKTRTFRSPQFALQFYASQMDAHQQLAAKRRQAFEAVFSGFIQQNEVSNPTPAITRLAQQGQQGYSLDGEGKVKSFSRYRPPANATSAMCWLGLAKGADSVSMFTWSPNRVLRGIRTSYIFDAQNRENHVLQEFAGFARNVRPLGKLMRASTRDVGGFELPVKEGDVVSLKPVSNPVLALVPGTEEVVWESFSLPGYNGKLVIVVNTAIGTLKNPEQFRLDDEGELLDFVPATGKRAVNCQVLTPQCEATDLLSGGKIPVDAQGRLKLEIEPGQGKVLYLTTPGSDETAKLLQQYGLPKGKNE